MIVFKNMLEEIKKLPLFILAGVDKNDSFGKKRLFELNFQNKKIPAYLIDEAKKANCFSEIYLVGSDGLEKKIPTCCSFIKASKYLWKNIKIIFDFAESKYSHSIEQIAILLSDILPSSEEIRDIFLKCQKFLDKDIIFLVTPNKNIKTVRGKIFLKKCLDLSPEPYSGAGGFYLLRPSHLNKKLIYSLISLRMPRGLRNIEVVENKIYFAALHSFKGILFFALLIMKILFLSVFFVNKIILFVKIFSKHQKRELTINEAERFLSQILIKKEYQSIEQPSVHVEIVENPVFVDDIDSEDDLKILKIKKAPIDR